MQENIAGFSRNLQSNTKKCAKLILFGKFRSVIRDIVNCARKLFRRAGTDRKFFTKGYEIIYNAPRI